MNTILREILSLVEQYKDTPDFLDVLFGKDKTDAVNGKPVIICCAGDLGTQMLSVLQRAGIFPVALCDNDPAKAGLLHLQTPILPFDEAFRIHPDAFFIIATHKQRANVHRQLIEIGVTPRSIKCTDQNTDLIYLYIGVGTQIPIQISRESHPSQRYIDYLKSKQESIAKAHDILCDEKSRQLLITKLALLASEGQFSLFAEYIYKFSEPYRDFGLMGYDGTPEDYYYFNNDIFGINDGEIYIDVGAFDGDTIETFIDACTRNGKSYQKIIAFEPDPGCFSKLSKNYADQEKIELHQLGLWSTSTQLRFFSTNAGAYEQGASISESGDIVIDVTSLDDFLQGKCITLLKMDPPGNIIPEVLRGAASTIRKYRPNLAMGAYHGPDSIFEIPILLHDICPEYRMALRQNTCHLSDTDLLATISELQDQRQFYE